MRDEHGRLLPDPLELALLKQGTLLDKALAWFAASPLRATGTIAVNLSTSSLADVGLAQLQRRMPHHRHTARHCTRRRVVGGPQTAGAVGRCRCPQHPALQVKLGRVVAHDDVRRLVPGVNAYP